MGVVFKQGTVTTVGSYLGAVVGYINVLWIFPAVLSAEEIGLIRILPGIAFLLVPFCQLGLSQTVLRFFPRYEKLKGGIAEMMSFMTFFNFVGFGASLILIKIFEPTIIQFFSKNSNLVNNYFHVSVALLLLISFTSIFGSFATSMLKIVWPRFVNDVLIRLMNSCLVALYYFEIIKIDQVINGLVVIYLVALLCVLGYIIKIGVFQLTIRFKHINSSAIKEFFSYSIFTLLGASGNFIILQIDQLMLTNQLGLTSNGIYTTAFFIAVVIEFPRRSLSQISVPIVSKSFEENDLKAIDKLYKQVSINQMVVGSLLLLGILVNLRSIFDLIPNNEKFIAGFNVVYIIGIAKLAEMAFSLNGEIIVLSKFYRYNVFFSVVLAFVTIVSNWFFIKWYGLDGAAIATALSLILFNLVKLIFLKMKLDLWPLSIKNFYVLALAVATYFLVGAIPEQTLLLDLLIRSVLTTVLFMAPILFLKISPEINGVIENYTGIRIK